MACTAIPRRKETAEGKTMTKCENCDSKLMPQFARVYGDNDGNVYRCIHCVDRNNGGASILRHGGGAIENPNEVKRRMKAKKY